VNISQPKLIRENFDDDDDDDNNNNNNNYYYYFQLQKVLLNRVEKFN